MIRKQDVEKLAELARIDVAAAEMPALIKDLDAIVEYVSQLDEYDTSGVPEIVETTPIMNAFRADTDPHEAGVFTEAILAEAPDTKDGYVRVKKILNND